MSILSLPFKIAYGILLSLGPIIIVLFILSQNLLNFNLHKEVLNKDNFYTNLSSEISKTKSNIPANGFTDQVLQSAFINNLSDTSWLKNFTETNINQFNTWLEANNESFVFQIPELNLSQTASEIQNKYQSVQVCNNQEENKLKNENINCLSDKLSSIGQDSEIINADQIQSVIINSELASNPTEVINSLTKTDYNQYLEDFLNSIKSFWNFLKNFMPTLTVLYFIVLAGFLAFLGATGSKLTKLIGRTAFTLGINTLIIFGVIYIFLYFSVSAGSVFQNQLFSWFSGTNVYNVLSTQLLSNFRAVINDGIYYAGTSTIIGAIMTWFL
jgi:hypothetical protein